jgi:hypothetical protein
MRTLLGAGLVLVGLAVPALADPVFGLWRTEADARGLVAMVQVVDCDDRICGRLVSFYDAAGRPVDSGEIGREYVWDMEPRGSGQYRDGRQWLPERGRDYRARMQLAGDRLTVTHCLMPLVCRDEVWRRVD